MSKSLIERITNIIHNSMWDFLNVKLCYKQKSDLRNFKYKS